MVHGSSPQNDHSQSLVGPAEVAPDNGVVDEAQCIADAQESADAQNGDAELQAVCLHRLPPTVRVLIPERTIQYL